MHASPRQPTLRSTALAATAAVLAIAVPNALASGPTTVWTAHSARLGTILVNARGYTLYTFTKGTECTGSCARTWKPLLGGAATGKRGANTRLITLSRIAGGNRQVTYDRHPLYTYLGDHRAGQTNGEGKSQFGGKWYAVNVSGSEVAPKGGNCNPVCGGY